jgi:hypothetical protein
VPHSSLRELRGGKEKVERKKSEKENKNFYEKIKDFLLISSNT